METLSDQARAFLQGPHFAVLITHNLDGTAHATGVCYLLENDTIVISSALTRQKVRNIEISPWASLCVIHPYSWVTVGGHTQIIDDPMIAQRDLCRIVERYDSRVAAWFAETRDREERIVTLLLSCEHILEYFETDNAALMQKELEDGEQRIWENDTCKTCIT